MSGSTRMVAYLRTILLRLRSSSATPSSLTALTSSSLTQTTSYYPHSSPILPLLQNTNAQPPLTGQWRSHTLIANYRWCSVRPSQHRYYILRNIGFFSSCMHTTMRTCTHKRSTITFPIHVMQYIISMITVRTLIFYN